MFFTYARCRHPFKFLHAGQAPLCMHPLVVSKRSHENGILGAQILPPGLEVKDVGLICDIELADFPPAVDEPLVHNNSCTAVDSVGGGGPLALHLLPLVGRQVQLPYLQEEGLCLHSARSSRYCLKPAVAEWKPNCSQVILTLRPL